MIPENSLNELLLAQMVYEKGENFSEIATALSKHPLLKDQISKRLTSKVSMKFIVFISFVVIVMFIFIRKQSKKKQ